ncbi:MAG TPA: apolipoprotein N-acyltransferase, partial [Oligoflexia bacterium]|nr:apolipoprotein N-acyltransferase [Oligoflexia bacterium]
KQIPDASLRHPFPDLSVPLIFGGQLLLSPSPAVPVYFSSAFLLMPSGLLAARYDKRILIPFAERKPFPGLLQRYLPHSGRPYSLETGRYRGPLAVTIGHGSKQLTFRAGLAICYEEIWPEAFWGPDRADTPQLLISLSNDAWFGSSHAAAQHQLLARWRAIELGRYLIRSTNSGVSSLIGPDGRVAAQLAPHQASYLAAKNVGLLNTATLFSRLGSMPLRAGTLFLLFLLVAALVRERAQVHHKTPRRPLPRRRKPSRYAKNMRQVRTKRINTGEHIS